MTIDHITIRLYTCCKCGHQWTNWDSKNKIDGRTPLNCPSCRNVRWNQSYTNEDLKLVEQLEEQHMIKRGAETIKSELYAVFGRDVDLPRDYFDFIAYDFLWMIRPQPEIFEIKQVLKIPYKTKMEQRHDLMLSIIHDRIENKEKFEKEYFSKYSTYEYIDSRRKMSSYHRFFEKGIHRQIARRRMKGCKHGESLQILVAYYKNQYYKTFDMLEWDRLPDSDSEKVYAEAESILKAEAEAMGMPVKGQS